MNFNYWQYKYFLYIHHCKIKISIFNILFFTKMETKNTVNKINLKIEKSNLPTETKFHISEWIKFKMIEWLQPLSLFHNADYLIRFFLFTDIGNISNFGEKQQFTTAYQKLWYRNITNSTRKKYLKVARLFSDYLVDQGIIHTNQARIQKNPRYHATKRVPLTDSEISVVFTAIEEYYGADRDSRGHSKHWLDRWHLFDRNRLIMFFLVFTWVRRTELVNICVSDIFQDSILVRQGKGGKSRFIPIPDFLYTKITKFIEITQNTGYLFTWRTSNDRLQPRTINTIFQKLAKLTNIDIYAHRIRHTYATDLSRQWVSLQTIQGNLGHGSITTTANYISIDDEKRKEEIKNIQNRFYNH